jgi:ferredoxin-NADP reductase
VVLFAGGIGITPFMAYLESLAAQSAEQREHMHPVWLHYANRTPDSEAYADRIDALEARLPRLTVHHYYSNAPHIPEAVDRFATSDAIPDLLILARARFYLCGPALMMRAITEGLVARGVPAFDIFSEAFRSPARVDMDSTRHYKVRFERSNIEAVWSAPRGTLLGFAGSLGLALANGCGVGQCESCAIKIIRGQVRHLHGGEPEDPNLCLACQAVPTMDLVLDV